MDVGDDIGNVTSNPSPRYENSSDDTLDICDRDLLAGIDGTEVSSFLRVLTDGWGINGMFADAS